MAEVREQWADCLSLIGRLQILDNRGWEMLPGLLWRSARRAKEWPKQHESLAPSCIISIAQITGGSVKGGYFPDTLWTN